MKKSTQVTLTVVAVMGMAGCNRHRDPCQPSTFNELACQDAVRSGGYYWNGRWYGMSYGYPYPYYYDSYRTHVSRGGTVVAPPASTYARPTPSTDSGRRFGTGGSGSSAPASGVTRGGFGSTGSGSSSGS